MFTRIVRNKMIAAVAVAAASVAPAHAIEWIDTVDPTTDPTISTSSYLIRHDIRDNGFVVGVDTVNSVDLDIWLYDDSGYDANEYLTFRWEGSATWNPGPEVGGSSSGTAMQIDFNPAFSLLSDGLLDLYIKASSGDFKFHKSQLVVNVTKGGVPVTEPLTLGLFGLGVLGLGLATRRRRS